MIYRACFLAVILLTTAFLFARASTDVIILKNGDRITGEIKGLNRGVLTVSLDYVDGNLAVDWSEVAYLKSNQIFVVLTEDGSSYEGSLISSDNPEAKQKIILVKEIRGDTVAIEQSKFVKIGASSKKIRERFNGAINLGVIYSKGNNATQYSFGADSEYIRKRWGADGTLSSTLSSNTGSDTSARNQLGLTGFRLLPWDNYFYAGLGNFLQSTVQEIQLQTVLGGGIGHFFKNTNRSSIAVLGGMAWQGTTYTSSETLSGTQSIAAGLFAAQVKFFSFKKTSWTASAILVPAVTDPGRVLMDVNSSFYLKIFGDLSWNSSFYGNWDNKPPLTLEGSDYGTSVGLGWTFGNR